jgi:hypothetical protein
MIRLLLFAALGAYAHDLGITGVNIEANAAETIVRVQVHGIHVHRKDPIAEISNRLKLTIDGQPFTPSSPPQVKPEGINDVIVWEARQSVRAGKLTLAPIFPDIPSEKTLVSVLRDGEPSGETVLDADSGPTTVGETTAQALWRFVPIGIEHILLGPDHIAFLLALLLPGGRLRALVTVITGFTISHSITLALAVMRLVTPVPWLVEGIIALSIVAAAGENLLSKGETRTTVRALYAAGFGLVHGFGFAGALGDTGLPHHALGWALAGFNIGVEIGQLAIVAIVVPLLAKLPNRALAVKYGSMVIMAAGLFWTVQRLFLMG